MAANYLTGERAHRMARRTIQHIRANTTDMAETVLSIDPSEFVDQAVADAESTQVFYNHPMVAAHSSEIPTPGAFATLDLNRTNVLLTRKPDGKAAAFVNACRHRGVRLVDEDHGRRKLFTCKYHGWTYDNDGALKAVPFPASFGDLPCRASLIELPVEERHGFIWVIENPDAKIDVAAYLGEAMDAVMSELNLGSFHFFKGETLDLPQNWKIMLDGLLDSYHVRFLHQKTIAPFVYHNIMTVDTLTDHSFQGTPRKRIDEVLDSPPESIDLTRYMIFSVFLGPNTQLTLHPHHIEYWTMFQHPDGPSKCRTRLRFLTPERVQDEAQREILDKNYSILLGAVLNEDVPAGNSIQASSAMPQVDTALVGRNEVMNQVFHRTYNKLMAGETLGTAIDDANRMRDQYDPDIEMSGRSLQRACD